MTLIDDIKRDREAGTPSPWVQSEDGTGNGIMTTPHESYVAICIRKGTLNNDVAVINARRIARVPNMEAALLAADDLAEAIMQEREMVCQDMDLQAKVAKRLEMALAAYRAAVSEAAE